MGEIKPKMVDGEAMCDSGCGYYDNRGVRIPRYCRNADDVCAPWYRARVAALESALAERDARIEAAIEWVGERTVNGMAYQLTGLRDILAPITPPKWER